MSPHGRVLASGAYDKTVILWSLPEGELLMTLRGQSGEVNALTITPDGKCLVSGGQDGTLGIVDSEIRACRRGLGYLLQSWVKVNRAFPVMSTDERPEPVD